ncbi:hypothetical protein STCU_10109 [Strigomonas culicis]|uniref:Ubiquitin-like protease family profile domain-containing protein n=1 Tax=Strigomonas culicis TaxID=28005 RepID=S9TJG1_9TRYP|nr:hypothetical protein STCU_10109 [Strigomonas culicis]|eukprot:EPY18222.1 hypothetical protein STCU_10109 [Strigomonas culicis]
MRRFCVAKIQHILNKKYNTAAGAALRAEEEYIRRVAMKKIKLKQQAQANQKPQHHPTNQNNSILHHLENYVPLDLSSFTMEGLAELDRQVVAALRDGRRPPQKSTSPANAMTGAGGAVINIDNVYRLNEADIRSLVEPRSWLNDAVINAYLALLCASSVRRRQHWIDWYNARKPPHPQAPAPHRHCDLSIVAFLNSHFYVKVQSEMEKRRGDGRRAAVGADDDLCYNANPLYHQNARYPVLGDAPTALRWVKKQQDVLLGPFDAAETFLDVAGCPKPPTGVRPSPCRAVLIPLHVSASHWTLAVLNKEERVAPAASDDTATAVEINLGTWYYIDSLCAAPPAAAATAQKRQILEDLNFIFCESYRQLVLRDSEQPRRVVYNYVFHCAIAAPFAPPTVRYFSDPRSHQFARLQSVFTSVAAMRRCGALWGAGPHKRGREGPQQAHPYPTTAAAARKSLKLCEAEQEEGRDGELAEVEGALQAQFQEAQQRRGAPSLQSVRTEYFQSHLGKAPQQQNGYDCGVFLCEAANQVYFQNYNLNYHFFFQSDGRPRRDGSALMRAIILLELYTHTILQRLPGDGASSCITN